jgi:O-antigen/teichoic acid export membrane protein
VDDYVIREQELTDNKVNTAFWINVAASIGLCAILVLCAPLVARVYKEEQLRVYLPALSLGLIVNSVGFVPSALLRKQLAFKKLFVINFAPLIISLSITFPLGYMKFGPWAIVAGSLTLTLLTNVYFLLQSRWRPRLLFEMAEVRRIVAFGKYVMLTRVQEYLYANLDVFLIGYFLDLRTLGIYGLAKSWAWLIFGMVTSPVAEILYPAFQRFANDIQEMGRQFLEVEKRIFFVTVPTLLIISGFATKTIELIFPGRWREAGLVLAFLIVGEGVSKGFSLQRDLFKLIGRPDIYPKAFLVNFCFTILCYPVAAKIGLITFLLARVGNDILYTVIQYYLSKRILRFCGGDFYRLISSSALSSAVLLCSILVVNFCVLYKLVNLNLFTLAVSITFCTLTYIITHFLIDRTSMAEYLGEGKIILGLR